MDNIMAKKIVLFNGPPSSGKDTAANLFAEIYAGKTFAYKMALPLKEACHKMLGLKGTLEELEPIKELPVKFLVRKEFDYYPSPTKIVNELGEMTLRQFYIHVSENFMKPMFGPFIFGDLAVENINNTEKSIVTVSDSGFAQEAMPIIKEFKPENVYLVKVHRNGKTFGGAGDSRGYIELPVKTFDLNNNGTFEEYKDLLQKTFTNILG